MLLSLPVFGFSRALRAPAPAQRKSEPHVYLSDAVICSGPDRFESRKDNQQKVSFSPFFAGPKKDSYRLKKLALDNAISEFFSVPSEVQKVYPSTQAAIKALDVIAEKLTTQCAQRAILKNGPLFVSGLPVSLFDPNVNYAQQMDIDIRCAPLLLITFKKEEH